MTYENLDNHFVLGRGEVSDGRDGWTEGVLCCLEEEAGRGADGGAENTWTPAQETHDAPGLGDCGLASARDDEELRQVQEKAESLKSTAAAMRRKTGLRLSLMHMVVIQCMPTAVKHCSAMAVDKQKPELSSELHLGRKLELC